MIICILKWSKNISKGSVAIYPVLSTAGFLDNFLFNFNFSALHISLDR